jgi:hypothetical protein
MSSEGQPTTRLVDDHDRWEYRVMLMGVEGFFGPKVDLDQLGAYLNEAGNQGWELVTVVPITRGEGRTAELMGMLKRKRR